MTELLDLCYDVLIRILEEINPEDLAACAQTSRDFNDFIKKNKRLYKAHYLANFVCGQGVFSSQYDLISNRMTHDESLAMPSQIG